MAIDKEKLKDGLKTAFNTGVNFVKEATPYVMDGLTLAGQVANSLAGKGSSGSNNSNAAYKPSNQTQQYQTQMNNLQKPVQQTSQWQQQLNDTMNAILNREKFSYDVNGDALFQQLKDQHVLGGMLAQQEAVGQASAMTGGYGNSYAQTVGQQQFQGHMQQLTDKIPELYQLALNTHNQETQDLYNRYGMLAEADAQEYARYRDQMSDYYTDRDYLANQYYNERDFDYNKYVDDRNYQYQLDRDKVSDEQWQKQYDRDVLESDRQYEYQLARDAVSDKRYDTEWQYKLDRDAVDDGRYDQQWQYRLDRDAVDDKWRETEWQYQLDRDKVNDEWLQKDFDERVRQYNASLAEDQRQANLNYELAKKKAGSGSSGSSKEKSAVNSGQKPSVKKESSDAAKSFANASSIRGELAVMAESGADLDTLYEYIDTYNAVGTIGTLEKAALREYCEEIIEKPSSKPNKETPKKKSLSNTASKTKKEQFTENLMNQTFYLPHSGLK